jgi:zinc protease
MKFYLIIVTLCSFLALQAPAQDRKDIARPSDPLPTVDEVLDKYFQAIGGKPSFDKLTSRYMKGTFELEGLEEKGTIEQYSKSPNKFLSILNVPGYDSEQEGFDGKTYWVKRAGREAREVGGTLLAWAARESVFNRETKLKELFAKLAVTGKKNVGRDEAYIIEATPPNGEPERLFFSAKTGLLIRRSYERNMPQGLQVFDFYLDDYREVDGIKLPFTINRESPLRTILRIQVVKHNIEIEDEKFSKPKSAS